MAKKIAGDIAGVSRASENMSGSSGTIQASVENLSRLSETLKQTVDIFKIKRR